jgi:hypothetical protein
MMQTITKNQSSCYLFDDSYIVEIGESQTFVQGEFSFYIADCNSENAKVFMDVTPPADWVANKYLFDGHVWDVNPDYIEPTGSAPTRGVEEL